jgi:asparagine synthase (glutamine-hydrolysing)
MCGIAGFIDKRAVQASATQHLAAMLERMQHRGPDERGTLILPKLGCYAGMNRLSIIDLQGGQQPIWNEDQTIAVFFNGEIYNYIELRQALQQAGHSFRTNSDTEVLVHLYEEHGQAMANRLRGMFVFAIVDVKARRLLIARDHFGQKPVYFHASGDRFAFGSEVKTLFALPFVPREKDREAFLDYISWFSLPAPHTHFKGIHKLAPGHLLDVEFDRPGEAVARPYWQPEFNVDCDLGDITAAADEVERAIDDSIRLHLRSDVPVGVMLSGGIDSRIVAEFARVHYPHRLKTFSVTYEGPGSEGEAARAAAAAMGAEHHELLVQPSDLLETIEEVAWHLDDPVADPAAFAVLKLCRFAREHVKVLLGGEGGDELFAGYTGRYGSILGQFARSERLRHMSGFLPTVAPRRSPSRWRRACYRAHRSRVAELIEARIEGFPGGSMARRGLTDKQLARLARRAEELGREVVRSQADLLSTLQVLDLTWQLPASLLMKSDKMSMGASLELRCPLLDVELANIARRIPPHHRMRDGALGKLALRECLRRRLGPLSGFEKKGFPIPLDTWLRGPLREAVHGSIFAPNSEALAQLDTRLLHEAWEAFINGEPLGTAFYALWLYETWRGAFRMVPGANACRIQCDPPVVVNKDASGAKSAQSSTPAAVPLVSIAIPCHNAGQWIAHAIRSALEQTWPNKEIIVVDDGSTDDSLDVIRTFGDAIWFESGPNRGGNAARNRLLEMASGEWLQYLDADDYLLPRKIECQLGELSDPGTADVAYSPVTKDHWEHDRSVRREPLPIPAPHDPWSELIRWSLPQTGAALWRRSALIDVGGWKPNQPCCQEHELYLRMLKAGRSFQFCPTSGAVYRIWSTNTVCHKNPMQTTRRRLEIIDAAERHLEEIGFLSDVRMDAIALTRLECARSLYQFDRKEAVRIAALARTGHPTHKLSPLPCFPSMYRWFYSCIGFRGAEVVARFVRPWRLRHIK